MRTQVRRFVERHIPALVQEFERLKYGLRGSHYLVREGATPVLADRGRAFQSIPGMIPSGICLRLYLLAYGNASMGGDIIEIGSWQGRSTAFLAEACKDSGVGIVHAIDHFRGNPGQQRHYVTGADDLSDLEARFRANIERVGLSEFVQLHAADAHDIVSDLEQAVSDVRLLFIDGEHTPEAVQRDIELYAPLLSPGGLIVFDDYTPTYWPYVRALQKLVIGSADFESAVSYERTLVARKR